MSSTATPTSLPSLPSFRRQQLLLEFAALKHQCPEGIYLTLSPNDPSIWNGVFFVREGVYASAVLRFEISFPSTYPDLPPLVVFSTEIFHPLLVPLTTYTISTGAVDPFATFSASETERQLPGSFNLRHGFPDWRHPISERGRSSVGLSSVEQSSLSASQDDEPTSSPTEAVSKTPTLNSGTATLKKPTTIAVLNFVKSAFEDPQLLDAISLESAGNTNAWHAWRSYRGLPRTTAPASQTQSPAATAGAIGQSPRRGIVSRNPADWNWDGVWEARVRNGIEESAGDASLFGTKTSRGANATDSIRFSKLDEEKLMSVQEEMLRLHGFASSTSAK